MTSFEWRWRLWKSEGAEGMEFGVSGLTLCE
jgi:hypothetical protein